MFVVSNEMYADFEKFTINNFVDNCVKEFAEEHPERFAEAGEIKVREFIDLAVQKAQHYNMLAEREVKGLITLMTNLGCDFDIDPMFPWARFQRFPDKGKKEKMPESFVRLQEVLGHFNSFQKQTSTVSNAGQSGATKNAQNLDFRQVVEATNDQKILKILQQIHPSRYAHVPQQALAGQILYTAEENARELGLDAQVGKVLIACLMFLRGVSVIKDPLFVKPASMLDNDISYGIMKEQEILRHVNSICFRHT
ncbi:hypothetical protein [Desulfomicrobium salsuginis]